MPSIGALSYADRIKKLCDTQTVHLSVVCLLFTSVSGKKREKKDNTGTVLPTTTLLSYKITSKPGEKPRKGELLN